MTDRAETINSIMCDLGMKTVSRRDGEFWPSKAELINPDLSDEEIARLEKKYHAALNTSRDLESQLYPYEHGLQVWLNYLKLKFRLRKALRGKNRGSL